MSHLSYAETVAAAEAAERAKELAKQMKFRVCREKYEAILEASYNDVDALDNAVGELLTAEAIGELDPADYNTFIENNGHIFQAEREKNARISAAVDSAVADLKERHAQIQSKPWQIKEIEQLYTDFFKRLREHDCSESWMNHAKYEVSRLKSEDAELIQHHEWRKVKELREQQAVAEKKCRRDQAAAVRRREKDEADQRLVDKFFARMETFAEGLVTAGVNPYGK